MNYYTEKDTDRLSCKMNKKEDTLTDRQTSWKLSLLWTPLFIIQSAYDKRKCVLSLIPAHLCAAADVWRRFTGNFHVLHSAANCQYRRAQSLTTCFTIPNTAAINTRQAPYMLYTFNLRQSVLCWCSWDCIRAVCFLKNFLWEFVDSIAVWDVLFLRFWFWFEI